MTRYSCQIALVIGLLAGPAFSAPSSPFESCSNGLEPNDILDGLVTNSSVSPLACSSDYSGVMTEGVSSCSEHLSGQRAVMLAELLSSNPVFSVKDYWSGVSEMVASLGKEGIKDQEQLVFARCLTKFSLERVDFVPGQEKAARKLAERKLRGDDYPRQQYVFRRLPKMISAFSKSGDSSAIVGKLASIRLSRVLKSPEFKEFQDGGQYLNRVRNEIASSCDSPGVEDREQSIKSGLSLLHSSLAEGYGLQACFAQGSEQLNTLETKLKSLSNSFCSLGADLKALRKEKVRITELRSNLSSIGSQVALAEKAKKSGNDLEFKRAMGTLEEIELKDCGGRVELALQRAGLSDLPQGKPVEQDAIVLASAVEFEKKKTDTFAVASEKEISPEQPVDETTARASLKQPQPIERPSVQVVQPDNSLPEVSEANPELLELRETYQTAVRACDFAEIDRVGKQVSKKGVKREFSSLAMEYKLFKKLISVGSQKVGEVEEVAKVCKWDEADQLVKNIEQSLSRLSKTERRCAWQETNLDSVMASVAARKSSTSLREMRTKVNSIEKELDGFSVDSPIPSSKLKSISGSLVTLSSTLGACSPSLSQKIVNLESTTDQMREGLSLIHISEPTRPY